MTRPHIEFIQSQVLPWQNGLPGEGRSNVDCKVLSADSENGESSLIVRYPKGWSRVVPGYSTVDEEFFVLNGEITINGMAYGKYSYANFPAGTPRNNMSSQEGAIVLTFVSGSLQDVDGEAADGFDEARLVARVDLRQSGLRNDFDLKRTPWKDTSGMGLTNLRIDPETLERTWVIGTLPMNGILKAETHPVVEEMYLLEGSMAGNLGVMHAGAYFWRPANVLHGPYGSRSGCLILFRSRGGPLSTDFHEEGDFSWTPDHKPILPPELEEIGGKPWSPAAAY